MGTENLTIPVPTPTERELTRRANRLGIRGDVELVTTSTGPWYAVVGTWGFSNVRSLLGRNRAEARAALARR